VSVLNSFVLDFVLRQRVAAKINIFYVNQLPIPRLVDNDPQLQPIVERVARLICTTEEFDELAREAGLCGYENGVTDPDERARLRAELDGMIAHLYGLTEDEFAYILTTFPLVDQAVKDAALEAYRALTPHEGDPEIIELIQRGESPTLEFKENVFWDDTPGKRGEKACWKTVAAFLNTDGGDLLIGVHDEGQIIGLEPDYARLSRRPERDGWLQQVTQFLINAVGAAMMSHVRITIHQLHGRDVCRIRVKPSPNPAWVKEGNTESLYIRVSNTTRQLTGREAADYILRHWPH